MLYQAPSPQRKKEAPPKENKLRLFLKRSSEPLLNLQNAAQQVRHVLSFTSQGMFFALQSAEICDSLTPTLSSDTENSCTLPFSVTNATVTVKLVFVL